MKHFSYINQKIFTDKPELASMRAGFGGGLVLAGEKNKDVVALCADLRESVQMEKFAEKFPGRFVEVGVAEQNLVTVASGMAAMGKIPFAASYAVFSPGRAWEQIRTTICYNNTNVKLIGSHAGLSVGPDGGSHQMLEDIALMRVLPNMTVLSPCDAIEARKMALAASEFKGPVYMRLCREKTAIITTDETPLIIGKAWTAFEPTDSPEVGIVVTGALLGTAIKVACELEKEHVNVEVLAMPTIKPLDTKAILKLVGKTGALVVVEEHQMAGGLGSAIAELLARHGPAPIEFVAVKDVFGQSGTTGELWKEYGLDEKGIRSAIERVAERKTQKIGYFVGQTEFASPQDNSNNLEFKDF
ncbi:MAG: transketolase C-terminal domain-containing protein [Candidatus Paceibacterota bacterium]|jgi:transketolase